MEALNAMLLSDKKKAINLLSNIVKNDSEHVKCIFAIGKFVKR